MRTGFTYKGVHSSKMDVTMRSKSRPVLPEVRQSLLTLPSADGSLDYSSANEYGRAMYEDRVFSVMLYLATEDVYTLQRAVSKVAVWLSGSGELIFDDMPDAVWDASVINEIDFAPELDGRKAILTVNFRVKPFSHALFDISQGAVLDDDIVIAADIPLDFNASTSFSVPGTGEFNAFNYGSAPVRAKFVISPINPETVPGVITLSCRGRTVTTNYAFTLPGTVEVDMEKRSVVCGAVNASGYVTGEFFELLPGDNAVTFTESNGAEYVIDVIYVPRFIYNTDWSVKDA